MLGPGHSRRAGEVGELEYARDERRFRLLAEAIPQIVWTTRPDGYCDYQNQRWTDYSGLTHEESVGLGWMESVHPDDRERCSPVWGKAPGSVPGIEFEYRLRRTDGVYRWFLARAEPILDDEGQVVRWFGTSTDIDDARRFQDELRESEERFRGIFENAAVGIAQVGLDGRWLRVNDRLCEILGHPREILERLTFQDITHPDDLESDLEQVRRLLAGEIGTYSMEKRYLRPDGSVTWANLSVSLLFDGAGRPASFISVVEGIDDRKANRDRLELGLQVGGLAIADIDYRAGTIELSPEAREMFGLPEDQAVIPRAAIHAMFHPDDRLELDRRIARSLDPEGDGWFAMEHRIIRPDGEVRWHSVRKQVIFRPEADGHGPPRPARSLLAMRDVTEARRLEEALREADRRKDEFLAMLAHEFRTPLGAIRNSLRLMSLPGVTPEDLEAAYDVADRQSANLSRLVDDLLDVSRISTGKIQLKRQRLDASEVVERAARSVRPFVDARRHELTVALGPGPMPIEGDPTRLEQILTNLLNNAAKYTDEGGKIRLDARTEGNEVVLRVIDSGVGLAGEMLSKIFDLFAQVDASIDRAHGGLGIGLTLVKTLAEMHGGRVAAASDGPGLGSTFTVRLPLLASEEKSSGAGSPAAGPGSGAAKPRRILLVDDSPDLLRSMARLLELSGHKVIRAIDGPSALEAARTHDPEVVILDIGLPGMSGYDVAQALRRDGRTRAILVALSGYAQERDRERSREAGFDHHLSKPVDLDALLAIVGGPRHPRG